MERSHGEEAGYNDQILIVCVHGARELPSLLAADHRLSEVQLGPDKLGVVASFFYLGDMLSAGGGYELTVTTRVKTPWKKFRELLPVLTSRHLSYKTCDHVYSSCMRSVMLHVSETWPLTKTNLQHKDRTMIRQVCSIKPEDVAMVKLRQLLAKRELEDLWPHSEREKASLVLTCGVF